MRRLTRSSFHLRSKSAWAEEEKEEEITFMMADVADVAKLGVNTDCIFGGSLRSEFLFLEFIFVHEQVQKLKLFKKR